MRSSDSLGDDARALAAADFTIADYDVIAVFFPNLGDVTDSKITYGGLGSIGGANHWINGSNSTNIILHEFGHNYGLYHANYWDQSQTLPGEYDVPFSREYGDIFDRMGSASAPEGHFNHFHKNRLEWMPDSKVAEPVADATIRLYRFDHVNALANPTLAIKVPMGGDVFYWVGYRQLFTASSYNLASGAYIVAEGLSEGAETNLIDATPGSASPEEEDRKDSGLEIGAPFVDSGVTFTALARGGSEPNQWIDIGVSFAARVGLAATEVEIDEQAGLAWLTFQRQFSSAGLATVNFSTTDGSATAPADYYASAGTVTWPAGDTAEKVVAIPIRPDALAEGRESFTVTLTNATGASLDALAATATVSLLDPGQRCLTFAPGFFNNRIDAIVPLPNGQVLIGGNISANSGDFAAIHNLALLNPDGSVDPAFLTGSGFDGQVFALAVQADGNILVGGDFTSYDGTPCAGLVRLHSNGTIETAIGGVDNGTVRALALESDGKILVGGDFTSFAGSPAKGMVRLTSSGARDTAAPLSLPFVTPWDPTIHAIVLEADGRITVAGSFYIGVGGIRSGVARLHPDGTTDDSFDPGVGAHSAASTNSLRPVFALARQPDGKYLLGGFLTGYDGNPVDYLVRIDSDGSYDPSFTPPPFDASVRALALQPDGSVVAGGSFTSGGGRLVRLTPTGAVDSAFAIGTGTSGTVYSIAPDDSGMLYVGGNFFNFNGQSSRAIIKLAGGVSPYDLWARETFTVEQIVSGEADPQADPDADLSSNASERALGTDPLVPNGDHVFGPGSAGSITLHKTGGKRYLQVSVEKGSLATGAWFVAQFTRDAHDWSPAPSLPGINAVYDILEDSASRFVVRDKTPLGTGRRFVRIGIAHPQ